MPNSAVFVPITDSFATDWIVPLLFIEMATGVGDDPALTPATLAPELTLIVTPLTLAVTPSASLPVQVMVPNSVAGSGEQSARAGDANASANTLVVTRRATLLLAKPADMRAEFMIAPPENLY